MPLVNHVLKFHRFSWISKYDPEIRAAFLKGRDKDAAKREEDLADVILALKHGYGSQLQ